MAEEKLGLNDIIEEIDKTFKPLELISLYIIWKNDKELEANKLKEELKVFIEYLTPDILDKMIDYCVKQGLIKKYKNGFITKI